MAGARKVEKTAEEIAAEVDTGGRGKLTGWEARLIPVICFIWACYQLYIASPLPFWLAGQQRWQPRRKTCG